MNEKLPRTSRKDLSINVDNSKRYSIKRHQHPTGIILDDEVTNGYGSLSGEYHFEVGIGFPGAMEGSSVAVEGEVYSIGVELGESGIDNGIPDYFEVEIGTPTLPGGGSQESRTETTCWFFCPD